ncbi:hypothetical protein F5B21DRAFT_508334 [Xylaria acuta]|nr:hypothetical protein F5B21DRAFT_508334 [Xylaria acuta]
MDHEFADKFGVEITDDPMIWPSDSLETGRGQVSEVPPHSRSSIDSSDAVLMERIEGILQKDGFTLSLLDGVRKLRSFQPSLRRPLLEKPELLHRHKPRAPRTGIRGRDTSEPHTLKHVQSISLSLDKITDTPTHLAEKLFPSAMKDDLYIIQSHRRDSDDRGIEFLQELCKVLDCLSLGGRIVVSGIYSSTLRRQPWIPASGPGLPTSAFPVHHIFHRTHSNARRRWWTTRGVYVGDGMLSPLAFAAGLLRWLVGAA